MLNQKMTKRMFGALAMISAVLIWSVGALAEAPMGIQGGLTVTNVVNFAYVGNTPLPHTTGKIVIDVDGIELVGLPAATRHCRYSFGPHARMSTPLEVDEAGGASPTSEPAWVNSTTIEIYDTASDTIAIDTQTGRSPGRQQLHAANAAFIAQCVRWSSASGFAVGPVSRGPSSFCDVAHPIACSIPVSVPAVRGP